MHRRSCVALSALVVAILSACVPQVRGERLQRPFRTAPEGTRIALVSIEVPAWVAKTVPKTEDPTTHLRQALAAAFRRDPYELFDLCHQGVVLPIGPNTKPQVMLMLKNNNPGFRGATPAAGA